MNRFVFFLIFIICSGLAGADFGVGDNPTVERSVIYNVVGPNDIFEVTIDVYIPEEYYHYQYDIEDNVPVDWTITDPGDALQVGKKLSWSYDEAVPAEPVGYTYTVQAPGNGSGLFYGTFIFDGMNSTENIYGDSQITVGTCSSGNKRSCTTANECDGEQSCYNGYWGVCVPTESFCDTDCDGDQECTLGSCAQCACTGSETQTCLTASGCDGMQTCSAGIFGECVPTQYFCDFDCDGSQECTDLTCPQCSCNNTEVQSCITSNGCAGEQYCIDGVFGSCILIQFFCDDNCDGTQECMITDCEPCSCTGNDTQSCLTTDNCQGLQTCNYGELGQCVATQYFCDTDCDGGAECSDVDCPPCGCTENWVCSSYGDCISGIQSRTCTDMNSCGTIDNKPALSSSCQDGTTSGGGGGSPGGGMGGAPVPGCKETWECTDWTKCTSDSLKHRNCIDTNNCGTTEEKPFDMDTCQYPGTCMDGLMNGDEKGIDCGGRCESKCQAVPEDIETRIEIIAEPINAEVFDEIEYSVIVRNIGTKKAGDISVSLDKWAEPAKTLYTISPGKEKTIEFSLKITGDYSVNSLQVQVLYGNTPLKTTSVPVDLKVPEYAVKGIRKGDELYAIAIVDNRESESRQLEVSYEIIDNKKILLKRSMSLSAKSESVLQQTDDRQILLPEGRYEIVSTFYENGQKVGEYRTTITSGQKTAQKSKILYIAIPISLLIILAVLWIVMKKKH